MKKLTLIILTILLLWTIDYGLSTAYAAIPHLRLTTPENIKVYFLKLFS